jgi:hypothetical protein
VFEEIVSVGKSVGVSELESVGVKVKVYVRVTVIVELDEGVPVGV